MIMTHANRNPLTFAGVALIALAVFAATPAHAATIDVLGAAGLKLNSPGSASDQRTFSVSAGAGSEMLVVSTHNEGGGAPTSVFYGTQEMTLINDTVTGNSRGYGIFYLANPDATGDVTITYTNSGTFQSGLAYASLSSSDGEAIVLGDADKATSGTSAPSLSLNVPVDNSFVFVAVAGNQGTTNEADVPPLDVKLDIPGISSMTADAGYDNSVAAGTSPTYTFTTNSSSGFAISAASFHVIPAPAALPAGLMLLGFAAARRRRK